MIISKWPLYRNLIPNPNFAASGVDAFTASQSTSSGAYTVDSEGANVYEHTYTVDGNTGMAMLSVRAPYRAPITPGLPYSGRYSAKRVNDKAPSRVRMLLVQYDAGGTFLSSLAVANDVPLPVGSWVDLAGTVTGDLIDPAARVASLSIYPMQGSPAPLAGALTHFGKAMLIQSATPVPYFDGGSYGAEWDGLPNASTSTLYTRDISIDLPAPRYAATVEGLTF